MAKGLAVYGNRPPAARSKFREGVNWSTLKSGRARGEAGTKNWTQCAIHCLSTLRLRAPLIRVWGPGGNEEPSYLLKRLGVVIE